jgi:hypothetical protein
MKAELFGVNHRGAPLDLLNALDHVRVQED